MSRRPLAFGRRLGADARGATIVEFALIAPALLGVIFGVFDLGYHLYATTQLEGAIQEAARSSSIEGSSQATVDRKVRASIRDIVPEAAIAISRRVYADYSDIERPEAYTDVNANGACDDGEPFEDVNGNGQWDLDRGRAGAGGARDAVLYQVVVRFDRPFPVAGLIGLDPTVKLVSRTVLRNQPYDAQTRPAASVENCA